MRYVVDVAILISLAVIVYLISQGGVEKTGYQIGAFASQVSAGWHREKFAPGVQ